MGAGQEDVKAAALLRDGADDSSDDSESCDAAVRLCSRDTAVSQTAGSVALAHLQGAGGLFSKRRIFCFLAFLGLSCLYAMRANLSEASEPMQKHFGWTNKEQGSVLSSFFWGYVVFQVPGSVLAERCGGKRVFGLGVLSTGVLTLLLPLCSSRLWLLCFVRALMGLSESVTYPALNTLFTKWVPSTERAQLVAFTCGGAYFGTAIALPVSGALIDIDHDASDVSTTWPLVFYVFGAVAVVWFAFWEWAISSTPAEHPSIDPSEREYIEATTREDADVVQEKVCVQKSKRPPWFGLLTHPAAWALYINHFANNFCVYTLMTYLPKYLDEELGFDIKSAGFVASLPYILQCAFSAGAGLTADRLVGVMSVRAVRLLMELICFFSAAALLVVAGYMSEHRTWAVVVVSGAMAMSGVCNAGFSANFMDVSPHWAGSMFGISNTIANVAGILAPMIAGDLLGDTHPVYLAPGDGLTPVAAPTSHWRHVFFVSAAVYVVAAFIWIVFMRAKPIPELN
eukprot:TRINITY_DN29883_c0_g1_i1.p1 TRINITY_DN29883_c0_g1~~TRINITY_DN29883_c0_g1_i1.p1  ORF type:complete len:512 (+),score=169.61 TRINITY_DN29883_c0_g1_i1:51-1586(+)